MLKPYEQRVKATYALMQCFISYVSKNSALIHQTRQEAIRATKKQETFPLQWKLDRSKYSTLTYKGYASGYKTSEVSGQPRLYYDRNKPYEKEIPFYNHYVADLSVKAPAAYIIPQGWWTVIELLQLNKVSMSKLKRDTIIEVEVYRIDDYQSALKPYEMHHINSQVKVSSTMQKRSFRKGDYYIPMDQAANHFIIETLEPQGQDSYFAWNFFDGILGQKEGYSPYAFEDIAADYLRQNPAIKTKLEERRSSDTAFAKNGSAQLYFVYQQSEYAEPAYLQYPVYRVPRK
jgi:hypothetical protein